MTTRKAGRPLKSGGIAKSTGLDKKEITKALNLLKKEGRVVPPRRCYYSPAD
ncbi:MAG TPA: MarR family transcriptional regulator [candidate division WOR-3 bacterium]|uniref:MarR family transcriptional regulator n=1 Tax=candidate division WOR-3 bacterium TaxID=2052148 RepID=A0A7C0XBB4_UNCW3|nr:MarR family transcriptional regulator [candidate division WOR-3 bacterium]